MSHHVPAQLVVVLLVLTGAKPAFSLEAAQLRRDVTVLATPEAQKMLAEVSSVTIAGALEYQACDDKICYNPTRLP